VIFVDNVDNQVSCTVARRRVLYHVGIRRPAFLRHDVLSCYRNGSFRVSGFWRVASGESEQRDANGAYNRRSKKQAPAPVHSTPHSRHHFRWLIPAEPYGSTRYVVGATRLR